MSDHLLICCSGFGLQAGTIPFNAEGFTLTMQIIRIVVMLVPVN